MQKILYYYYSVLIFSFCISFISLSLSLYLSYTLVQSPSCPLSLSGEAQCDSSEWLRGRASGTKQLINSEHSVTEWARILASDESLSRPHSHSWARQEEKGKSGPTGSSCWTSSIIYSTWLTKKCAKRDNRRKIQQERCYISNLLHVLGMSCCCNHTEGSFYFLLFRNIQYIYFSTNIFFHFNKNCQPSNMLSEHKALDNNFPWIKYSLI